MQKSSLTNKISKTEDAPVLSKTAEKIDKIMKKAVDILERIQNLTVLAQDKNLTDSDRIEIQIEIEELRDNFDILPRNLITGENNSSRIDFDKKFNIEIQSADGSSILERMRERINNGEKCDVLEAYSPLGFIRVKQNEDGEEIYEIGEAGWYIVDDSKVKSQDIKTGEIYSRSISMPTVHERLEAETPYVVMDAESAEKVEILTQQRIEAIEKFRENLPELEKELNDDKSLKIESFLFLESIAFPGGIHANSPLIPDNANYFYNGVDIYDSDFLTNRISITDENGNEIQPYSIEIEDDEENSKNEITFKNTIENIKLSNEFLAGSGKGRDESPLMGLVPPDAKIIILKSLLR